MKYSILVQWSEEDQCYVVLLPEFAEDFLAPQAGGATYEEAMARGINALEHLVEFFHRQGKPPPEPQVYPAGD
jgi:antitoxin HicB